MSQEVFNVLAVGAFGLGICLLWSLWHLTKAMDHLIKYLEIKEEQEGTNSVHR